MSRTASRYNRQRSRSDLVHHRRLGFESLECRRLLTLAAFDITLYEDVDGAPGAAIEDAAVNVGDTFFLEISAEDTQSDPLGLHGISLDLRWDPDVFSVADPFDVASIVTDSLPLFTFGTLEPEVGRINDLTGSAALGLGVGKLVGLDGPETFAFIRFEARQTAEDSQFSLRGGKYGIAFFPPIWDQPSDSQFDLQPVTVVNGTQTTPTETSAEVPSSIAVDVDSADVDTADVDTADVDIATTVVQAAVPLASEASFPAKVEAPIGSEPAPESEAAQPDDPVTNDATHSEARLEVPLANPLPSAGSKVAEGEAPAEHESDFNACSATPRHRTNVASTPPGVPQRLPQPTVRSAWFVGPLLPDEYATHLILATSPNRFAGAAVAGQLDDDLADLLAHDVNSQFGRLMP